MKRTYKKPTITVIMVESNTNILAGSGNTYNNVYSEQEALSRPANWETEEE